ncbi:hypothetical protein GDO78_011490, partial [Eleutherodactylus coqui]
MEAVRSRYLPLQPAEDSVKKRFPAYRRASYDAAGAARTHQLKLTSNPLQRGIRKTMTLSCQVESGEANDVGVFWFRHLKSATSPESIVYLSATKKPTYKDQKSGNDRFIPNASGSTFTLDIKEFDEKDQGTYYCLINKNSVLHISPGYQLIYTEVATPKPKSTKPPPAATTDPGDPCNCGP